MEKALRHAFLTSMYTVKHQPNVARMIGRIYGVISQSERVQCKTLSKS